MASAGTSDAPLCMRDMKIVEAETTGEWRPWEPPIWLIALGLTAALLVGLVQSGQVQDPRDHAASPTPCVPSVVTQVGGARYSWTVCPER
jgi:hypothetical protein